MSFLSIRTAIRTKLNTLTGVGLPLAFVYSEHRTNIEGYPSASFEPSDMESDFTTTRENQRVYVFRIVIHQEIEKVGKAESIRILSGAIDRVITAFDTDITLGGAVDFLEAVPAAWGEYKGGAGNIKYAEIVLRCNKIISV